MIDEGRNFLPYRKKILIYSFFFPCLFLLLSLWQRDTQFLYWTLYLHPLPRTAANLWGSFVQKVFCHPSAALSPLLTELYSLCRRPYPPFHLFLLPLNHVSEGTAKHVENLGRGRGTWVTLLSPPTSPQRCGFQPISIQGAQVELIWSPSSFH